MKMLKRLLKKVSKWYKGTYVHYEDDPDSSVIVIGGYFNRHWTASLTRILVNFYLGHWKWMWSTVIAVVALIVAL